MSEQRTAPATRDLAKVVEALEIAESEFAHQVKRLEAIEPKTESERAHLPDLREGYRAAGRMAGVLRRYQQGRIDRRESGAAVLDMQDDDAISDEGVARAYVGDENHGN